GVVAEADAVHGPVRIDKTEVVLALVFTAGQADGDVVAGAHEVVLADRAAEDHARVLGIADAGTDRTGRLFLNAEVDVDLVIGARYGWSFHRHFLEVAQPLQTHLGLVDQVG